MLTDVPDRQERLTAGFALTSLVDTTSQGLRERARHYRWLAGQTPDRAARTNLLEMAKEMDEEASGIESADCC